MALRMTYCITIVIVALLLLLEAPAHAVLYKQCSIRSTTPCSVNVLPGAVAVLSFQSTVKDAYAVKRLPRFVVEKFTHEVTVEALKGAQYGNIEIKLEGTDVGKIGVFLQVVKSIDEHHGRIDFYDPLTNKKHRQKVIEQDFDSHLASLILQGFGVVERRNIAPSQDSLPLAVTLVSLRLGNQVKLVLGMKNKGDRAIPLDEIRVSPPNSVDNHAGFTRVESSQPANNGRLAEIAPGDEAQGYVSVENPLRIGKYATVTLTSTSGLSWSQSVQIWPPPDGPTTRELELAKQASVSVRLVGGAFWVVDGLATEDLAATRFTGLAVRYSKGLSMLFAFEAELVGARTRTACFEDITIEGKQGDLLRSATVGRVQVGGALRFGGATILPLARIGLGLHAASYTTEFIAEPMQMNGPEPSPESSTEYIGLVALGGGLDIRVTDDVLIGATASALLQGTEKLRTFELGLHLSYGWLPSSTRP